MASGQSATPTPELKKAPRAIIQRDGIAYGYVYNCTVHENSLGDNCKKCLRDPYRKTEVSRFVTMTGIKGNITIPDVSTMGLEIEEPAGTFTPVDGGTLYLDLVRPDELNTKLFADYYIASYDTYPLIIGRKVFPAHPSNIISGLLTLTDGTEYQIDCSLVEPPNRCIIEIEEFGAVVVTNLELHSTGFALLGDTKREDRGGWISLRGFKANAGGAIIQKSTPRSQITVANPAYGFFEVEMTEDNQSASYAWFNGATSGRYHDFIMQRFLLEDSLEMLRRKDNPEARLIRAELTSQATSAYTSMPMKFMFPTEADNTTEFGFALNPDHPTIIEWTDGVHDLVHGRDTLSATFYNFFIGPAFLQEYGFQCYGQGNSETRICETAEACICGYNCTKVAGTQNLAFCEGRDYGVLTSLSYTLDGTNYEVEIANSETHAFLQVVAGDISAQSRFEKPQPSSLTRLRGFVMKREQAEILIGTMEQRFWNTRGEY